MGSDIKSDSTYFASAVANLAYFGYVLSKGAYEEISTIGDNLIVEWWNDLRPNILEVTGDNREIADAVVYNNFPEEVLGKDEAEYWMFQYVMYFYPNLPIFVSQEGKDREPILSELDLKVLNIAKNESLQKIYDEIVQSPVRWTAQQKIYAEHLFTQEGVSFDASVIPFKENLVYLVSLAMNDGVEVSMKSATDVLRLAVALSDGDVTFSKNSKFRNFSRKERRFLLSLLEGSSHLEDDMVKRPGKWKKFMRSLHPGDYSSKFPKVVSSYNSLYSGSITSFNSKIENAIENSDEICLDLLKQRPGDFARRLNCVVDSFGYLAVSKFEEISDKLSVSQLLKLEGHFRAVNERLYRVFPPKGNWGKLQVVESSSFIEPSLQSEILSVIERSLESKMKLVSPVNLDESTKMIKLQTSDSELTNYGRGTVFPIPDNINFIRTASYWDYLTGFDNWFDNGWNFFDEKWSSMGACCWDLYSNGNKSAIFSGDPTNRESGKACQLIDLYLDKLEGEGIRYAVWSVLCYSKIPFSSAKEVYASMQMGEEAQSGKLFEPSRCQLSFPIDGDNLSKYVAYIDVKKREIVYMDANLKASVQSAGSNSKILSEVMPAFVEYLDSLPSVYDLFKNVRQSSSGDVVTYDDYSHKLADGEDAYVFKPVNENNSFNQISISTLLK